jgi:hypothetical protein
VYFWSDIRTNLGEKDHPEIMDIAWNLAQQINWVRALEPDAYMLKFKLPFWSPQELKEYSVRSQQSPYQSSIEASGIDFAAPTLEYLQGKIWLQPYSREVSAETRLVGRKRNVKTNEEKYPLTRWCPSDYEKKMFFYNVIERGRRHINPLADQRLGYDHCGDCAHEAKLWMAYKTKVNPEFNIRKGVEDLGRVTRSLLTNGHGKL